MALTSAPTLLPDTVALWRHALEALPAERSPCRYLTAQRWGEMRGFGLAFLDEYGAEAHRLGWTAPQLYGVHPDHGTLRIEMCGALMVNPRQPTGVLAERVLFGHLSGYRNGAGQAWGPPIWDFAAKGR